MEERRAEREREQQAARDHAARAAQRRELTEERVAVVHRVRALDARVAALRQEVARVEGELAEAKSRLQEIDRELDGSELK